MQVYKCGSCGGINFNPRRCKGCGKGEAYLGRINTKLNYKGFFSTNSGQWLVKDKVVVLREFERTALVLFDFPLPRSNAKDYAFKIYDLALESKVWVEPNSELIEYMINKLTMQLKRVWT